METWKLNGKDISVYTVGPLDSKMILMCVTDIFSMNETRVKACCDFLADNGFRIVFPDLH